MIEIEIGSFVYSLERVTVQKGDFERFQRELTQVPGSRTILALRDFKMLKVDVSEIERIASVAGMTSTQQASERTRSFLSQYDHVDDPNAKVEMNADNCGTVFRHLLDIVSRARDDCINRKYYQIDPQHALFLDNKTPPFGIEIEKRFPETRDDIEEAAKCFALNRSTATVFHLMRAAEITVVAAAKEIGATTIDKTGKSLPWGPIAQNIKGKIDGLANGPKKEEWYRIHAEMESMNRGWRTPTMHPKKLYNEVEAKIAFEATRAFMRHLASFL